MRQSPLKLFADAALLRHLDRQLLRPLLGRFTHLLQPNHGLPNIDALDNPYYFDCLAERLASPGGLPDQLLQALLEIEALAVPENYPDITPSPDADPADIQFPLFERAVQSWLLRPLVPPPGQQPATTAGDITRKVETQPSEDREVPAPQPVAANTPSTSEQNFCAFRVSALNSPSASTQPTPDPTIDSQPSPSTREHSDATPTISAPFSPLPSPLSSAVTDAERFTFLARLSPADYDRVRRSKAAALHIRVETLDAEVAKRRADLALETQTNAVHLQSIIPWPEPVDGAQLLTEVSERFSLHLVLPAGAADTIALWTAHAHAFTAFYQIPRLNLCSTKSGCGKTTTLDVIAAMVPRPLRTENLTAPVLFRLVHLHQPTLLLDEVDTYLHDDELRGLLNAGHKQGGCALRMEGEGVRVFNAFAPAVLAGIGPLPATLRDRSIIITLVPAEPGQIPKRWDPLHTETETILARKLARWTADNLAALAACDPPLPTTAFNRIADIWRPLFAIAQIAGGPWPQRALDAFTKLTAALPQPDLVHSLLTDIRDILTHTDPPRLSSAVLVDRLCALPGSSWCSANNRKPISETWLARRLAPLGIRSRNLRFADHQAKGYDLADFTAAFARILDPQPPTSPLASVQPAP